MRLTKMLTTAQAERCLASRVSWMWPAWRLPIVGTKTLSGSRPSRSRSAATELMMSIGIRAPAPAVLEAVLFAGEAAVLHRAHVALGRVRDAGCPVHEVLHEAGLLSRVDVEHVVQHQHLPGAGGAGADAYGRDAQAPRHLIGELCGDGLEHDHPGAGGLELESVVEQLFLGVLAPALHAVAAELVHRLRRQAEVAADRHAALGEEERRLRELRAAFDLDHLGARSHQFHRVAERLLRGFLERAERHVGDQKRPSAPARDAA